MVFVERSFPVFCEKCGVLWRKCFGSGRKVVFWGATLLFWGERKLLFCGGNVTFWGENGMWGRKTSRAERLMGLVFWQKWMRERFSAQKNPVGTDLASPKCRRRLAGFQVQKAFSTPKCHLVSRHFDGSAPTCHFSPRKTTCSPPHTSVLQAYAISSPQAPLSPQNTTFSPANLQLSLPNILLAPQKEHFSFRDMTFPSHNNNSLPKI